MFGLSCLFVFEFDLNVCWLVMLVVGVLFVACFLCFGYLLFWGFILSCGFAVIFVGYCLVIY